MREACPKEDIWDFSPFVIFSVPRYVWRMLRDMQINWQVMLLLAPVGLEFIRQMVGDVLVQQRANLQAAGPPFL